MVLTMISNENDSYQILARALFDFIQDRAWNVGYVKCQIYSGMVSNSCWYEFEGKPIKEAVSWPDTNIPVDDACFYLRDDLLQKTASRIWGLTFTLYPTGKFNIDYDYNKPEDYEESDEQITGAQANESLFKLGFRGKGESNE